MAALDNPVSYTPATAAEATGLSKYMVLAAIRSGDLRVVKPEVNGRVMRKYLIMRDDLVAWLERGDP